MVGSTLALLLLSAVPAQAADRGELAPQVSEQWTDRAPPVVGQGSTQLTVVLRGAREDLPVTAQLGEVQGQLEHLGLSVFALILRGVPDHGELSVHIGDRLAWRGAVHAGLAGGEDALVLLNRKGRRVERLPAALDAQALADAPPPSRSPLVPVLWLGMCLGTLGLALRGRP